MSHAAAVAAQKVLRAPNEFPPIIVQYAHEIFNWSEEKRQSVKAAWHSRALWKRWVSLRAKSDAPSELGRRRYATKVLEREGLRAELSVLHKFNGQMLTQKSNAMLFAMFQGALNLLTCPDVALIHKYYVCVNARKLDRSLVPVGYLRWCPPAAVAEILAWRLVHAIQPVAEPVKAP